MAAVDESRRSIPTGLSASSRSGSSLPSRLETTVGLDILRDNTRQRLALTDRTWVPPLDFSSTAPFVQLEYDTGPVTFRGGLRRENAKLQVATYTTLAAYGSQTVQGGSTSFSETVKNAGAVWRFAPGWSAFVSSAEGFGLPDVGLVLRAVNRPNQSVASLIELGAKRAVVLPLFYSANEARYDTLRTALDGKQALPLEWAQPFGTSYFAVEALADRLRALGAEKGRPLIVAGSGARDQAGVARVASDLRRIAGHAASGLGFKGIEAVVWPKPRTVEEENLRSQAQARLRETTGAVVVQLHLARKLDSMMAYSNTVKRALPAESRLLAEESLTPLALTWMEREANRRLPLPADQVGVVISAHGSDWHWNETMRSALGSLEKRYKVEYAFSMADAPILERAVHRLERRGVRAIVIVRVFGMNDSFKRDIDRLIGRDIEADGARAGHAEHGDHGHGNGPVARIRSAAVLTSAGGLDDHPLFAKALVARAKELSRNPGKETVILTAHGTNDDVRNAQWIECAGGRFLHHDGGDENSPAQLDASLAAADLVICQTGCISHGAYWRVKDHCKRTGKRCVFVEKPSASSLARGLRSLGESQAKDADGIVYSGVPQCRLEAG